MPTLITHSTIQPWNKGKLVGQKAPLKLKDIWAIRVRLQLRKEARELALFNLAIDIRASRLRPSHPSGRRRHVRRLGSVPSHRYATENPSTGAVRDHPASMRISPSPGYDSQPAQRGTTSSLVAYMTPLTYQHCNTHESSTTRSRKSAWRAMPTAGIPYAEPRHP